MKLIERYMQAVKFWLPRAQERDITAELSEEIRSQIEEKESRAGRRLNETEVGALLKQLGRPILVANRYLPQRYLIGPDLFPIYLLVVKIVALCYLAPWVMMWIGLMIAELLNRGQSAGHLGALSSLGVNALVSLGAVTLVFAVIERVQAKSGFLANWDPHKLPPVRIPNRIPRFSSMFEVVVNAVFATWWVRMHSPFVLPYSAIRVSLAPAWRTFFWGFLFLAVLNLAIAGTNLVRPYWTRARAMMRLLTDVAGAALFCLLCRAEIVAGIVVPGLLPDRTVELAHSANMWFTRAFPYAIGIGLMIAAAGFYRIYKLKASELRLSPSVAASR